MYDSTFSFFPNFSQPAVRDHSLAANFSKWMPRHSIVNDTTKAVFAQYMRKQRLAQAIARLALPEAK